MRNYRMRLAGTKTGEIYLYDDIGSSFFGGGVSAKQFADDLNALGKIDTLNVRMNSPGGDVFDGLAIYNTLKRHPANVIVDVDGMALSIASIIAMAGNEIRMAKNAMMMIHDPWTISMGTADDFREQADLMDTVKGNLVTTYADRTGVPESEVSDLMSAETWMTAEQAVKAGFADAVTDELDIAASFDVKRYRNAPKNWLRERTQSKGSDLYRAKIAAMAARARA